MDLAWIDLYFGNDDITFMGGGGIGIYLDVRIIVGINFDKIVI